MTDDADVVVIGGGLAGLSCARALVEGGARVVVLEARDRVGGRTLSRKVGRATFDLGGQWLGARQPRVARLARELGVGVFPTHHAGLKVLDLDEKVTTYAGTIPKLPPWSLLEIERALRTIEWLARKVPLEDPMRAPQAGAWDARTLEDWLQRTLVSDTARALVATAVRVVFGAEPRELSLLHFLFYARSGGGIMSLVEIDDGAQQDRFVEGAQELSLRLAARLGAAGVRIALGAPARAVAQDEWGVTVAAEGDGGTHRARYAVVAVPPVLAGRITYSPAPPPLREQVTQRYPMGATVKCLALYDRAFWREKGLSGEVVCGGGPVSVVFDNTSHDGAQPALVAFVVGQSAREWSSLPPDERRATVLEVLERAFGPQATAPTEYLEQDWSTEPWTLGCPVGIVGPGGWPVFGDALRRPVGRVHWAGTETATVWNGYMEGALESGERAAREVLARL